MTSPWPDPEEPDPGDIFARGDRITFNAPILHNRFRETVLQADASSLYLTIEWDHGSVVTAHRSLFKHLGLIDRIAELRAEGAE